MEPTLEIMETYEGYLGALEEDFSETHHQDHLSPIGKASALFWKAISEQ